MAIADPSTNGRTSAVSAASEATVPGRPSPEPRTARVTADHPSTTSETSATATTAPPEAAPAPPPQMWPTGSDPGADGGEDTAPNGRSRFRRALFEVSPRHPVRHLFLLAAVLVLLGSAAGFAGASLVTPQYAAQADVLYTITREQPTGFLREDRNLSTQLVVLRSRTVLERVAADNGLEVDDLAAKVTPTVLQESEVIHVELRDPDPVRARILLEEVTAQYLEVSNNIARSETTNYLDGQLREVLGRLDQVPTDTPARASERAALVAREQELRSQLDTLRLTEIAGPAAQILAPAYVDPDPVYPDTGFAAGTGALAGLLVALIGVAVLARRAFLR